MRLPETKAQLQPRLIGLRRTPLGDPASTTFIDSHPALTALSTARATTRVKSTSEDGSVEYFFLGHHWRSSSVILLQRGFDRHHERSKARPAFLG